MSIYAAANTLKNARMGAITGTSTLDAPSQWLIEAFGGSKKTASGIQVNNDNAIGLSAIFDGVRLLAESEAQLPLNIKRRNSDGNSVIFKEHPAQYLLHREPNQYMSSFQLRKWKTKQEIFDGNAFIVVERNARRDPIALYPVESRRVVVYLENMELYYMVDGLYRINADDMLHFVGYTENGYIGIPLIKLAANSLGHMLATETFGARFFGNGANISGIIKSDKYLKDEKAVERVKLSFMQQTTGMDNAMSVALLENGMTWERLGVSPDEAQFLGSRQFNVAEVARWLNIPVPMLKELGRATYGNIEHLDIQFVKYSLGPRLINSEQEYERKLLRMSERVNPDIFITHNVKGLLRGDTTAQANWYRTMWQTGAYSPNDILKHEDEPTYEGGNRHFVHSGAIPIEQIGENNEI